MDIHKTKKGKLRHKRRVPAFRQIEANDCGPTCIQRVSRFLVGIGIQFSNTE